MGFWGYGGLQACGSVDVSINRGIVEWGPSNPPRRALIVLFQLKSLPDWTHFVVEGLVEQVRE